MKTNISVLFALAVSVCMISACAVPAQGAWGDTITVTVTASGTYSVTVNVSTWVIGAVSYGDGEQVTAVTAYKVTNNGTQKANVEIKLTEPTTWTHVTTFAALDADNEYMLNTSTITSVNSDAATDITGITTTDSSGFVDGLTPGDHETFGLELYVPNTGTITSQQSIVVTLTGSAG